MHICCLLMIYPTTVTLLLTHFSSICLLVVLEPGVSQEGASLFLDRGNVCLHPTCPTNSSVICGIYLVWYGCCCC
ncbi:hypothetical protein HanIR_Chr09g0437741 [Helianthus annuus]|nr:hypothetical protein HanIR_Chr09g0437741 [Helianthus annuus]